MAQPGVYLASARKLFPGYDYPNLRPLDEPESFAWTLRESRVMEWPRLFLPRTTLVRVVLEGS